MPSLTYPKMMKVILTQQRILKVTQNTVSKKCYRHLVKNRLMTSKKKIKIRHLKKLIKFNSHNPKTCTKLNNHQRFKNHQKTTYHKLLSHPTLILFHKFQLTRLWKQRNQLSSQNSKTQVMQKVQLNKIMFWSLRVT